MVQTLRLLALVSFMVTATTSAFAGRPWPTEKPVPGQYDVYVLAVSYENDFCATHAAKKECQHGADHFGMALHGLWPNPKGDPQHKYQYCDLPKEDVESDWCAAKIDIRNELSPKTFQALGAVMPGVESCLYNHEWYAHGTCSGLKAEEYFGVAQSLVKKFRALPNFKRFLASAAGKTVTRQNIVDALAADLGGEVEAAIALSCRRSKPEQKTYFAEIDFALSREKLAEFPDSESFDESETRGSCPATGISVVP